MRNLMTLALLSSSLLVSACMNRGGDARDDSAENAIDSADAASAEGDVMMAAVDGTDSSALVAVSAETAAVRIAANISARYSPAVCATVTQTGATIHAVYDNCTGPRGLVHVSGELDLAIDVSLQGTLTIHGTSTNLSANGASLDVDATGIYTSSGTAHTLTVQTSGSGTGPRGLGVTHDGDYTISWDSATQCHTIDGAWSTDLGDRSRSNDVSLSRCAGGCPTGSVTHQFLRGQSVTIAFDGTATAAWSTSAGASGTVALSCP